MLRHKILHIIGQAHLDPVWLWPWRDGCSEALTTMQSALDRMDETPEFCFSRSSAITYRWAQEMDPRLFADIRARVHEGRWEVVNGWIEQPDCNIPSTESFVRHSLYGKQFFHDALGTDVTIGYNVDSFGHAGGLPQLLTRAGYSRYVFMRPHPHESATPLPPLFWWESPDGSRVLTWRIQTAYATWGGGDEIEATLRGSLDAYFAPGFNDGAFFFGVGNHGGGPTKQQVARLVALQGDASLPELRFSTLAQFFAALEASPALATLPVVRTELQHHATGCYAAMGEIKAVNRRAERTLVQAETLAVLAGMSAPFPYPAAALREAWWKVLFNQFHDILAGSSIKPAYQDARDSQGYACETGRGIAIGAIHALARRIDTTGAPEGVLVLVNPLPWPRTAVVRLNANRAPHGEAITHLRAHDGACLPVQWMGPALQESDPQGWLPTLTAMVPLPACGYRAFHMAHGDPPATPVWDSRAVVRDDAPGIAALHATDGAALLAAPIGLVVIDDHSDTWGHGVRAYRTECGRPTLVGTQTLEDGPVCRVVRQHLTWGASSIVFDVITFREWDCVELRLLLNWQEQHQILKLEIPTALTDVRTFAKTAGGVTPRMPTGDEEPAQDWVALEGALAGKTGAVVLINAQTYSYDCLDGLLRVPLVRSVPYAHHDPAVLAPDPARPLLDQGWQERRFWVLGGHGTYTDFLPHRRAEEAQTPAEYVMDSAHPGTESWEHSFLTVLPDQVAVTAFKQAEDGDGMILRLQEMHGAHTDAHLTAPGWRLDYHTPMTPWAIRTFRLRRDSDVLRVDDNDLLEGNV